MLRKLIGVAGLLSMVGLVVAVAPGCGSSDEKAEATPAEVDKYPDVPAFCNAIAKAECSDGVVNSCLVSSKDVCVSTVQQSCTSLQSDITRNVTYSNYPNGKKAADTCIQAVTTAYTDGKIDSSEHTAVTKACGNVFRGGATAGFGCKKELDCAEGLGCYLTAADAGTCQKISKVGVGEDCSGAGVVCDTGLYCGSDKACIKRKPVGSECLPFAKPCLENLLCVGSDESMMMAGTCQGKKTQGSDCGSDDECDSGYCAQVGQKNLCVNSLSLGAGAPACQNFGGSGS